LNCCIIVFSAAAMSIYFSKWFQCNWGLVQLYNWSSYFWSGG